MASILFIQPYLTVLIISKTLTKDNTYLKFEVRLGGVFGECKFWSVFILHNHKNIDCFGLIMPYGNIGLCQLWLR